MLLIECTSELSDLFQHDLDLVGTLLISEIKRVTRQAEDVRVVRNKIMILWIDFFA
jgi:hypothetical protein